MAADETKLTRWPENRIPPRGEELERKLSAEGVAAYRMTDPPCTSYPTQVSPAEEIRWVFEGRLVVGLEGGQVELAAGDRLDLAPGVRRSVKVVSENGAKYLLASLKTRSPR